LLGPRTSSTAAVAWSWPTWVVELETCYVSRLHLVGVPIFLEKNFYQLPFTPPSLVARSVVRQLSRHRHRTLLVVRLQGRVDEIHPKI
jgi:hypothetical protein